MAIIDWPKQERPREKLLQQGAAALSDAELLAIFLRTGVPGKSAIDLGRDLIKQFGNLRNIIGASQATFCQQHGLGPAKYTQIQAALEIAKRFLYETIQRDNALSNPADTKQYLAMHLCHLESEVFACLFLDNAHRVIGFDKLFYGTINASTVHARELVKRALSYNAAAVILAHNHPSGIAEPSLADQHLTQELRHALSLIEVRVLDHIIVGDGQTTSFAERGLL